MPGKENHNRIFDSIVHRIMHISYVAALLLDALPSFYYVMCGVFAIMPA